MTKVSIKSRPADAVGHDQPIASVAEDFYDRWPVASAIARTIFSAPETWSTRVGVFGRWGEGKTSVLKLLEQELSEEGAIVIWYSAWGAENARDFWGEFARVLSEEFKREGIPLTWRTRIRLRIARVLPSLESVLLGSASLLQIKAIKVPDGIVKRISELIERVARIRRPQIETMLEVANARRVVVMIDDLDRASPETVPAILLAVRELLDMPGFAFVLAFDPVVVSKSLVEHNAAWEVDGQLFIEKIIDFAFTLSSPSRLQVGNLARQQFQAICPFVPQADVTVIEDALPENPRKLRLFARTVSSYKAEVSRHSVDELKWPVILLLTLMQLESEVVVRRFVQLLGSGEYGPISNSTRDEAEANEQRDRVIARVVDGLPVDPGMAGRLRNILGVWDAKITLLEAGAANYLARFAVQPDSITWAEFDCFFTSWVRTKPLELIDEFVLKRADASRRTPLLVTSELLAAVVARYSVLLERAGEAAEQLEHARLVAEIDSIVTLYEQSFEYANLKVGLDDLSLLDALTKFIHTRHGWAHFTANPGEPDLREREVTVLVRLAASVTNSLLAFEKLGLISVPTDASQMFSRAGKILTNRLREMLEPVCVEEAIALFRSDTGIVGIAGLRQRPELHYLLCSPQSQFFELESQAKFLDVLSGVSVNSLVSVNARLYLQRLTSYSEIGGDPYLNSDERAAFLLTHASMLESLWRAATAFRLQYRHIEGIRAQRGRLIACGLDGLRLPEPDWMTDANVR
jgi:hypothetical protein